MPEIIIENGLQKGERFTVESSEPIWIGRDRDLVVTVKDPMVSRRHCRIEQRVSGYHILDNSSANGTFLNDHRRQEHSIVKGDRIQVGETLLTFFPDVVDDPLTGKTVSGFEVLERVGRGGMGTVYKARQISLDRLVALKVLSRDLAENRTFVDAFHREARSSGQINHPSIVQVYDVDSVQIEGEEITFFAMEYMSGGSVEDLLNHMEQLPELRVLEIALDTARGLNYAEKCNIVHRDIKPGNLMISEGGVAKIGDLGVARSAEKGKVSQKDGVSGSPHYIAPEQARGEDLDSGSDMYSLGISLFQMLTGKTPHSGSSARELVLKHFNEELPDLHKLRPGLDSAVVALVQRMTQKKREDRHENVASMIADIEAAIPCVEAKSSESQASSSTLRRAGLFSGVLLLVVATGALVGLLWDQHRKERKIAEDVISQQRSEIEAALTALRDKIEADSLEEARQALNAIQDRISDEYEHGNALADLLPQIDEVETELEEREDEAEETRRRETAQTELEAILDEIPRVNAMRKVKEFDAAIRILKEWEPRFPRTSAAAAAKRKITEIESARAALARRIQVASSEYLVIGKRVETLLGFDPPSFKSALRVVREFRDKHPETPSASQAKELLDDLMRQMHRYVADVLTKLEIATGATRSAILRLLQRLRLEVEGETLSVIDAALTK